MSYMENKHEPTANRVKDLRRKFNDATGTLDQARNAIQQADSLMEKTQILGNVAEKLNMEDLDPQAFVRNIYLYVDDFLTKLDAHVMKMERYGRL